MPKKTGRLDLIARYQDLLDRLGIPLVHVNQAVADKAAALRAKYDFLKAMDALQLAVAIESDCDRFITNDKGLLRFQELHVLTLDQF